MTQTFNDVQILGNQDTTQLIVKGNTTQTQPLQAWQNNSGSVLAQLTNDGRFQLGTTFSGAVDALLQVNYAPSGTQPLSAWHAAGTVTNPGTPVNWVYHDLQLGGTVPIATLQNGLYTKLTHNNTGAGTAAILRAATFQAINQTGSGAAPIGQVTGLRVTASNAGTAYLGTAVALEAALTNDTAGSINSAIALSVVPPVNAGTISALYGLQVADLTQGTATNYAVYTGRGAAHFGDNLELQVAPMGTVGNPPINFVKVYPKLVTGSPHLFAKDASGTEYDLSSGGTGSVTSVGLSMPAEFAVSNSPITSTGTLTVTKVNQSANTFMAGPSSGSPAQPAFRVIASADLTTALASPPTIGGTTPAAGTFSALTVSATGGVNLSLNANAGNNRQISFYTASILRWNTNLAGAESGSNAGADLGLYRWSDAGAYLGNPFLISRATGKFTLNEGFQFATGATNGYVLTSDASGNATWQGLHGVMVALSTTDVPLIVRGVASQTGDLTQWQNSSSTVLSSVNAKGQVVLPITSGAPSNTPNAGAMAFDNSTNKLWIYNGSAWKSVTLA